MDHFLNPAHTAVTNLASHLTALQVWLSDTGSGIVAHESLAVSKSGRGPGIFYHMSDVEGREKVERT